MRSETELQTSRGRQNRTEKYQRTLHAPAEDMEMQRQRQSKSNKHEGRMLTESHTWSEEVKSTGERDESGWHKDQSWEPSNHPLLTCNYRCMARQDGCSSLVSKSSQREDNHKIRSLANQQSKNNSHSRISATCTVVRRSAEDTNFGISKGSDDEGKCAMHVCFACREQVPANKNQLQVFSKLNKMQIKYTEKQSSKSGAKVTGQESSKWTASRREEGEQQTEGHTGRRRKVRN